MDPPDYGPVREVPSIKGKHPVIQYDSRLNPGHVYEFVFNRYVERTSTSYYVCLGCRSMKRKDKLHQLPPATRVTVVNGRLTCNPENFQHFCIQTKKGLSAGKRALYSLSQSLSSKRPQEGIKLAYESAIDGLKNRNDLSIEEQHEAQMVMLGKGGYASKRRGLDKAAEKYKFYNLINQKPYSEDTEDLDAQADEEDDAQWEMAEKRARLENDQQQPCSSTTPQAATVHVVSTALVNLTSIVDPNCAHLKGRGELVKLETMDDYEPQTSSSTTDMPVVKSEPDEKASISNTTARELTHRQLGPTESGMISLAKEVLEEGLVSLESSAQEDFWSSVDRMARVEDKGMEGQRTASLQNQLLLLFFSFFSHANLDKKQLILKNLPNLAKNQVVARQILKFLFALCRTTSKQLAFEVVGELWAKHNWIANEPELEQYFVRIDQKSDDRETTYLKMGLIRRICKIQQGERFVPQLLNLLHPNHPEQLLAETILALTDLCGQSLLKVDKVKAKVDAVFPEGINSDVKWPRVVSAYCNLLSTSAVDPNDYNLALTYVEELWQLKNSSNQEVCVSAWNSLSKFPLSTLNASRIAASPASSCLDLRQIKIEEGTCSKEDTSSKLTGIQLLAISKEIQSVESYQAFGNFLHKVISCEVEELPKPYYTEVKQESRSGAEINTQSSSTLLLVNLMPVLRETLENGGTSSLDLAAFALAEPITKHLQPNTKRMAKCTHLLSYALLKARADSNLEFSNTLNYFASWKSGIEFSFRLFHETRKKTNVHFTVAMARDMFIELMQKAIDQVKDAAVNVVCCLPFLWDTVNDMLAECPAESVDIHWQVSVVEYLLMLAIEDYQPKSLPIFQKETMRTCQLSAAAFFSLSLILHRHTIDYYNNACLPELILRNISSSCPAWMEYLIKGILWLASSPLPPQPQQPLVKVKLEPTDEGDLEQQQASPTSTTGSPLSLVVNSLVNNIPISQTVDLLEICQSRHNVKVLSNILNVNPSLVANILDELPNPQGLQDKFKSVAKDSNLAELANLKTAFQLFSELTESDHLRFGHQFAKRIEKTIAAFNAKTVANQRSGLNFSNATKNIVAECASCCLGEFYVGNLPGRSGAVADSKKNYKELPRSLLGHLRTDFKSLPPIDWAVLYSVGEQSTFYRHLFQLAVQQKSAKLLTKLLQANHLNLQSDLVALCPVITPNIQCLLDLLPNSIFTALLDSLLSAITLANYPDPSIGLVKQLAQMSISDPSVRTSIWRHAPSLQAASLLMHPFYNHFSDCFEGSTCPNESKASLENNLMQAWLEAKKKFKMNVQKIVTIFARITSEETPVTADTTASSLLILAKCSMELSNKERIAFLAQLIPMLKIVKVSFRSKNSPRDHKSVQVYFDLLVAFVSSQYLGNCHTQVSSSLPRVVTQLLAADRGCDGFKEVVIYLVELYCPALTEEQTKAIKACLRSCVISPPTNKH
uniref:Uncharacterized protein n=1 Tax=Ditylenchus dipsaci TaxID=166011 RepID=A0A915DA29_9BILA